MAEQKKIQFTPRDMEISAKVWACLEGDVKIDFKKLAELGPYKNEASARETWLRDNQRQSFPVAPKAPTKRKRATAKARTPATPTAADNDDNFVHGDDSTTVNNRNGSPTPTTSTKKARCETTASGGGRKKKGAVQTPEIYLEPIYDDDEPQMQQLKLVDASAHYEPLPQAAANITGEQPGADTPMFDEA
ncbi:uncharacterized protein PG998_005133 [Apiospora kogelbergensis]|uniref:uncharacterized protein n=1 Tax=Apiospora kogelbergensis TaxID=1337665 RepID=UPI00313059CA